MCAKEAHIRIAAGSLALVVAASLTSCASSTVAEAGRWVSSQGTAWIEITDSGLVSANDGCNQIAGLVEDAGDQLQFVEISSTKLACDGIASWVEVDHAVVEGDIITLYDEKKKKLAELEHDV